MNENVSEKLINFIFFLFKLKDNDANKQLKQKKEDKNTITYRKIKIKYIFLMINYINSIYSEKYEPEKNDKNEKKINPNFLEKYYDRILNNKNEPFIIYYLSLILFLSNVIYESVENFINKTGTQLNFWTLEILYVAIISYLIFKNKIDRHKKIAISIMFIITIVDIIENFIPTTKHKLKRLTGPPASRFVGP